MKLSREPALIIGVIQTVLVLVVTLGLHLPLGADAAILAVSAAVLALVTRSQVSPVEPGKHAADEPA